MLNTPDELFITNCKMKKVVFFSNIWVIWFKKKKSKESSFIYALLSFVDPPKNINCHNQG